MPTTTISCPACSAHLSVPMEAAGKTGRCPFCHKRFTVPSDAIAEPNVDEDLISDWLMSGSEDEDDEGYGGRLGATLREKDPAADDPITPPADDPAAQAESQSDREPAPPPSDRAHHQPRPDAPTTSPEASEAADAPPAAAEAGEMAHDQPTAPASAESRDAADHTDHHEGDGKRKQRYVVQSAVRPIERDAEEQKREQEALWQQLREHRHLGHHESSCDHERLNLLDVQPDSVLLGFEARLLLRDGFRASMPIRCLECGDGDREGMVARPLPWRDRAHGGTIPSGELETRYSCEVHPVDTPRDVLSRIPIMDELISPFNRAIPYYLCRRCAIKGGAMCSAHDSPRGVLCEVTVPDGSVALEWLGRVNGVCGAEYAQLEQEVARFESDVWQQLGEQVRRRITAWFRLKDDEQFIAYINDSDFGKKDAGLAGVALTDRRAVFCKYHRHGKLKLNDPDVELLAVRNGPFYDLVCKRQGSPQKLVRLRPDDLATLKAHFAELNAVVTIQQKDG